MSLRTALITGVTGQDGAYLAAYPLEIDDLADALIRLLEWHADEQHVNVGVGVGVGLTIAEFSETLKEVTGFRGRLVFDRSKPDGMVRKLLDTSHIAATGWQPKIKLQDGLVGVYEWFLEHGC